MVKVESNLMSVEDIKSMIGNSTNLIKPKKEKITNSLDFLSQLIIRAKYSQYLSANLRRELWDEILDRNLNMHINRYPDLKDEIISVYNRSVRPKKVVPSMRSLQFGGKAIVSNMSRMYNCAAVAMDASQAFPEVMFLLLGGSGVGISIQKHHIEQLDPISKPNNRRKKFVIDDSIMGWADAVKVLVKSYFKDNAYVDFDFSQIRKKGTPLKTAGGKAPGPEPLADCLHNIRRIMDEAIEERGEFTKLKSIEVHDICCFISNAVLAGGIRRSSMISLFSPDDEDMLKCKGNFKVDLSGEVNKVSGNLFQAAVIYKGKTRSIHIDADQLAQWVNTGTLPWFHFEEQRGRANNTVVLVRHETSEEAFRDFMKSVKDSKAGEPGILWTNDKDMLTNPCGEISIPSKGLCNLTEVNASYIESEEDLHQRVKDATFLGTLQAGYTEFHYLRDEWRENAERDALLGVSYTGIASGELLKYDLKKAAKVAIEENIRVANIIGINPAKRIGTCKPAGTSSIVLRTSSGIHAWYNDYYIRRIRFNNDESIFHYVRGILGEEFIEKDLMSPSLMIVKIPVKAPDSAITRTESPFDLLERVKKIQTDWISETHIEGINKHNVSVTVSVKPDEWEGITDWMWDNRENYSGISLLDYDGSSYIQPPNEDITKEEYESMHKLLIERLKNFDMSEVVEVENTIVLEAEAACAGGKCEIV